MNKQVKILTYIYSVRIYSALITIILIPILIDIVGLETYGLIGFFTVLQACLSILDAGLGSVITREAIISRKNQETYKKFNILYKKIVMFFLVVSFLLAIIGWWISEQYSASWLNTQLDRGVVVFCTTLMFWIFALRYMQGPSRSILLSNESQVTLTTINLFSITLSQPLTIFLMKYFNEGIEFYFSMQLISSAISCALMVLCSEKIRKTGLLLCPPKENNIELSDTSVKKIIGFALQLSTLSILWVLVNQSDKLALTKYSTLTEYGIYSVAVSIISVLAILSDPLNQYLQPKLTRYYHQKNLKAYSELFSNSLIFIFIVTIPLSAFLVFYSKDIIFIWSGNETLSVKAANYLPWLFIGGVFSIYSNFVFLLLYSFGELKKHTIVYALFSIIVIPVNIFVAKKYFGEGTSIFFGVSSAFLFLLWGGYNFAKFFIKGLRIIYLYIIPLFLIELIYFKFSTKFQYEHGVKWILFVQLFLVGFAGLVFALVHCMLIAKRVSQISLKITDK
ncbi:oligosaccharide flippase family protein [Escherichia sp. E1130]|uniref:lipopolysaccharide biosynthesis protein n=1 Tax=Escherichia sp. E1130 TaxID=2041645 RepID=UPI0010804CD9|nr:oligosaccharide flippase family protein [Escherichia sp. E1130]TGC26129.1 O10 family O-antigen flippase [Escherichia sp. E1130]TLI71854.1 O10 family O-antigen flippase [Escherichia sp. E1130]